MVDFGLSPGEFWELTWYEWGLYLLRYARQAQVRKADSEERWNIARILWATIINRHRGPNEAPKRPEDLLRLSFDAPIPTGEIEEGEDPFKKFGKTMTKTNGSE